MRFITNMVIKIISSTRNINGTISYEGLWINSMAHGRGKFYNEDGDLEFDGYFYEGEPNIKFKDSILKR